jgi:hypothetical protein
MAILTRRLVLALFGGLALQATGCDLGSMAYFLMPEAREPAKMKSLASADPKKEPRVVILTWNAALEMRSEFIHADRQISDLLAANLRELAGGYKEKLSIVDSRKVEEYKNNHPNWRSMDLRKVGQQFDADYLIYLEINSLSLYEPGGTHLFRGRAQLTVNLIDVRHPDKQVDTQPFSCVYPPNPIPADLDTHPLEFRQAFLTHVAKRVSYYFSCYPKRETYFTE